MEAISPQSSSTTIALLVPSGSTYHQRVDFPLPSTLSLVVSTCIHVQTSMPDRDLQTVRALGLALHDMAAVPTIYHTWSADTIEAAGAQPMALHLAMQALVQNQVDQILKEMHVRRWSDWTHEDLRGQRSSAVQRKKALLLENIPGLLAGPHAAALRHEDWLPCYILSAAIPISQLREKSHGTSLQVFNIVWEHRYSKALSVTFYNNHLDAGATFDSFVSERLSTNRRSQWALGVGGGGFLRACHYIVGSQQKAQGSMYRLAVAVRVGHSTGEFVYRSTNTGKEEFALRRQDLTPLSFKCVESQHGNELTYTDLSM